MPTIKGTGSIADDRARTKLVRSTKFPASFSRRVDTTRAHRDILTQWIEDRITALLGGLEDEIVQSMAVNLFLPPVPEDGAPPAAGGHAHDVEGARIGLDRAGAERAAPLGELRVAR